METQSMDLDVASAVRVGDAERESCLAALGEHHAEGRLSVEELDERQRAALSAVTAEDLDKLLADLPPGSVPPKRARSSQVDWWSQEPRDRMMKLARWAAPSAVFATAGALVASVGPTNDVPQFAATFAAGGVGFATHWLLGLRKH